MRVLIAGCGWLGAAVAARLLARGDQVLGVRRDAARAEALRPLGVEPLVLDLADPASASAIPPGVDAILALQSASRDTEDAYRRTYLQAGQVLLQAARRLGVRALVYTGSTGVFSHRDGSDVEETTPLRPGSPSAQALADTEGLYLDAARSGLPARILRLSGLYGPGRAWMVARVRSGAMALGPGDEAWVNACHRDDAAAAVLAVLDRGRDGAVYHATDAQAMRRRDVVQWVAARLGIEPARSATPWTGPDRRIRGERTRAELGLALAWPSLREGLEPLLD
jgi:nucleoside-diphosphate-sugar epimerase